MPPTKSASGRVGRLSRKPDRSRIRRVLDDVDIMELKPMRACRGFSVCDFGLTEGLRVDEIGDDGGVGINSRSSSSLFPAIAAVRKLTPVTLPPGRLRLVTSPS